ncbi:hypothetical protein FPZ12_021700 [Amycolatopsis acidicola]|uniref:WXG100 family type VII secretion target n=1 Tax=Amycolatopsis acidicola TaxID=2596893 RepID=A0A5N0UYX8_9PSEU|nr:hypothetical protein [Amycolatopsis acidicola]KAA9158920.1 hypothetical protein FPZ12_021700 [Amycolatopsis acidicola]
MTGFEADAEKLAARAGDFTGFAERAGQIAADLGRALEGASGAWGDDVVGRSFAAAHAQPAAETADKVQRLAGGLGDVGGKFAEAAKRYQAGDEAAGNSITDAVTGE